MKKTKLCLTAILFHLFVLQVPWQSTLLGQEAVPETAAGKALAGLLASANSSDGAARAAFLKDGFQKNDDETVKQRIAQTEQLRSDMGKLTFKKTISSSEHRISAACETENGPVVVITVTLTDKLPHKIHSVALEISNEGATNADDSPLNADARTEIIERLASELRSKYVFPDVGNEMASAVEKSLADGEFDKFENANEFASQLSEQLLAICHDKHLRVRAGNSRSPGSRPGNRLADNHGFVKAEILPCGIGYLKFNHFSGDQAAQDTAAAAMNFLGNSNALIFDLRENGGGSPLMIAFLTSYLFDEPVHLNSFYNRPNETTTESWTQKDVPGKKFPPSTPVFVLTSSRTFSGAEEFSYNLKNLKRGTIVGETTGGGAHPVMPVTLGHRMHITMPFARAINPITQTNWEGVGVEPDVEVPAGQALEKAFELAKSELAGLALSGSAEMEKTESAEVNLQDLMKKGTGLMADESFDEAIPLFARITSLDPENGEAWYKYGFCLHVIGNLEEAMDAHKKAAGFEQFAEMATYNLACAYSLKNDADQAIAHLKKAIDLGFGNANQIENDSDLDNIRKDQRYADLIQRLRGKQ